MATKSKTKEIIEARKRADREAVERTVRKAQKSAAKKR